MKRDPLNVKGLDAFLRAAKHKDRPARDDNVAFERWLNEQLDRLMLDDFKNDPDDGGKWFHNGGPEILEAERGNIEPLRQSYPHLAKYLHLPPMKKGQRRVYRDDQVDWAMEDYQKALVVVEAAYETTRRERGLVSIAEIIARRHSFPTRVILNRLKNSVR